MNPKHNTPPASPAQHMYCEHCGCTITPGDAVIYEETIFCDDCYNDSCYHCSGCDRPLNIDHRYYYDDEVYCYSCYSERLDSERNSELLCYLSHRGLVVPSDTAVKEGV